MFPGNYPHLSSRNSNTTNVKVKRKRLEHNVRRFLKIQIQPMLRLNVGGRKRKSRRERFKYNQC